MDVLHNINAINPLNNKYVGAYTKLVAFRAEVY